MCGTGDKSNKFGTVLDVPGQLAGMAQQHRSSGTDERGGLLAGGTLTAGMSMSV